MNRAHELKRPAPAGHTNVSLPALIVTSPTTLAIRAGARIGKHIFREAADVVLPALEAGGDYGIVVEDGTARALRLAAAPDEEFVAGFHFAPGGNALARAGGDATPAINPCSLWDANFRPACPDPRGMTFVSGAGLVPFWCDIYLTGADHVADGTSRHNVTIADGDDPPQNFDGGRFKKFDYDTAVAVLRHHGKQLLGITEFFTAAFGVTEKSAAPRNPKLTGLDAPRTSKFGLMQATGNMWTWGHDGDPDEPRASIFGGPWVVGGVFAGSRCADVVHWPGDSSGYLGARGRCDHLQLD